MGASKLAIQGGIPLLAPGEYKTEFWPPRDEKTAEMLKELYLSGKWSFNSEEEQAFEREFAACHGAKHGIFMTNGTVTMECALIALGVKRGDEVIVPGFTWLATATAALYVGATPVFADIEPDTCCLSPEALEKAITPKTRAIIPVHIYGGMADLEKILVIGKKYGIPVIEDCAHMQGGKWNGRGVGSWGAVGSFSFQQSKTLCSGEGGICLTNDDQLADLIYRAKHIGYSRMDPQGAAKSPPPAEMLCHNYRGLAFSALILRQQLKTLDQKIAAYNQYYDRLKSCVSTIPGVRLQARGRLASPQGYYGLQVILDPEIWGLAKTVGEAANAEGMPVSPVNYGPVYKHMLFNTANYRDTGCPQCDYVGQQALSLSHTAMWDETQADKFAAVLEKVYSNRSALK